MVISPAGACMQWDSLESLLEWAAAVLASGQHTVSCPSQSSVARLAACARQLCDPGQHPGGQRPPGLPAAHGEPSESVVSGEVGSSRPPIMRPGTALGRAAAAGVASCKRRAIRVSRQWRDWQLAPANYATRVSTRAGRSADDVSCTCWSRAVPEQFVALV